MTDQHNLQHWIPKRWAVGPRLIATILMVSAASHAGEAGDGEPVRAILERSCWKCHGAERQKGDLRLDRREAMLRAGDDGPALVPGDPAGSAMLQRILSTDPDERMPPRGKAPAVTAAEAELLRAWIQAGAPAFSAGAVDRSLIVELGSSWQRVDGRKDRLRQDTGLGTGFSGEGNLAFRQEEGDRRTAAVASWSSDPETGSARIDHHFDELGTLSLGGSSFRRYDDQFGFASPDLAAMALPGAPSRLHRNGWVDWHHESESGFLLTLRYEYWGLDGTRQNDSPGQESLLIGGNYAVRGIRPAVTAYHDDHHRLSASLAHDWHGLSLHDTFSVDWQDLRQSRGESHEYGINGPPPEQVSTTDDTQNLRTVANAFTADYPWSRGMVSFGHHVSSLSGTAAVARTSIGVPTTVVEGASDSIVIDQNSNIINANLRLDLLPRTTLYAGLQADWDRSDAVSRLRLNNAPATAVSSVDTNRYSQLIGIKANPFGPLFLSGQWDGSRSSTGHYEYADSSGTLALDRDTRSHMDRQEWRGSALWRFSANTSWRLRLARETADTRYRHDEQLLLFDQHLGYSAFLERLEQERDTVVNELRWRSGLVDAGLSWQYEDQTWHSAGQPVAGITPGGSLQTGDRQAHTLSLQAGAQCTPKLYLSGSGGYAFAESTIFANDTAGVADYSGDDWFANLTCTWSPVPATRINVSGALSGADYSPDSSVPLPQDISYTRQQFNIGCTRQVTNRVSATLEYGYGELRSTGNAWNGNYTVHTIGLAIRMAIW